MARRWSRKEEREKFIELERLYIKENRTIGEIAHVLGIAEQTVFQRMMRLGIPSTPERKTTYIAKRRSDITVPKEFTEELAEFFGIMLGDGKLSKYQIVVTLGSKELLYAKHVVGLIKRLVKVSPKIGFRSNGFKDVYLGSLDLTEWLRRKGLVYNKVLSQVDAPEWIFYGKKYLKGFLRGFFDTDGSVYKLRFGIQLSFTNRSLPLLNSVRYALISLGFQPSLITKYKVYLTRRDNIEKFFREIKPANPKHQARYQQICAGSPVGSGSGL